MKKNTFRGSLHTALKGQGFFAVADGVALETSEVRGICAAGVSRKNTLISVSLGFWMFELGGQPPDVFWKCHVYGSLGSILDGFEDVVAAAGLGDEVAMARLISDRAHDIAYGVRNFLTVDALVAAFQSGSFSRCFIKKDARSLFESKAIRQGKE